MGETDEVQDYGDVSYTQLLLNPSLLAVLMIGFIGSLGTNAIPAALPAIGNALTVSTGRIGLVMTVFFLPVIAMNPIVGVLVDIYGRRRIVIPALFLFGATGVLVLVVESYVSLLALRAVQGVAFAGTLPLSATLVGDLYTGSKGAAAQGLRSSMSGIANAVAPVVAGVLAVANWRYPFLLFALAFPILGLVYVFYPEPIQASIDEGPTTELKAELHSYWQSIRTEANDRSLLVLVLGGFALFFIKQGMKAYVPVFAVDSLGAGLSAGGLILGVYGGVRVLVAPLTGVATARFGRKAVLLMGLLGVVLGTALIPVTESVRALLVVIGLFAAGEALFNPSLSSGVADLAGDDHRGGIMSSLATLKSIANTISPALIGVLIAGFGFTAGFGTLVVVGIAYGTGLLLFGERRALA
jgi:MFS family permease